jgi:Flp pilus assembly protein TadD
MADRFTYVPMIGLLVAITWAARDLAGASTARIALLAGAALLVGAALATVTGRQIAHWKDSEALFTHAVEVTHDNWLAHNNLGIALVRAGRPEDGIAHFAEALRIEPTFAEAEFGTGLAFVSEGRTDEAVAHFELALQIDPTLWKAHNNLGVIMLARGDLAQALAHLTAAVRHEPDSIEALENLRQALARAGQSREAVEDHVQAVRTMPARIDADLARPEGAAYDRVLSRWFMTSQAGVVQRCVDAVSSGELAPFELFMTVQADGAASELLASPPTAVGTCMAAHLARDRFPPPPFAPFHAHMPMNFQGSRAATSAAIPDA